MSISVTSWGMIRLLKKDGKNKKYYDKVAVLFFPGV
jgi:hypothetical protein